MPPTATTAALIVRAAQGVYALAARHDHRRAGRTALLSRDLLFAAVFLIGCARAFEMPTSACAGAGAGAGAA